MNRKRTCKFFSLPMSGIFRLRRPSPTIRLSYIYVDSDEIGESSGYADQTEKEGTTGPKQIDAVRPYIDNELTYSAANSHEECKGFPRTDNHAVKVEVTGTECRSKSAIW